MRTIQEIQAWLLLSAKEHGRTWPKHPLDSYDRGLSVGKESLAMECLRFIESEPPCSHPNKRFFDMANTMKLAFLTAAGSLGATNHRNLMKSECSAITARYCPDCGERLSED